MTTPAIPTITSQQARRLALHAQGLALPPEPGQEVADVVERIGCLQLDPVSAVARSPLLVLRARLRGGTYESHSRALDRAAYEERVLFDYWCHEASLCHVADLPVHRWAMRTYIDRLSPARAVVREWLEVNEEFAGHTIAALRENGPMRASELEDRSAEAWVHGHWTDEVSSRQTIARMLDRLWMQGQIGVASRHGTARRWDLMERCLPEGELAAADAEPLAEEEVVRTAALRAVGMLGVARAPHVNAHFTRRRYPGLDGALAELEGRGELARVGVEGLRGEWWIRSADLERIGELEPGRRTVALSPFDNLLCDRARTAELFNFDHRLEIYTPQKKRRWGYYVLPILHRERIVARADLKVEQTGGTPVLRILSLHKEPGRDAKSAVQRALTSLANWRGASELGSNERRPARRSRTANYSTRIVLVSPPRMCRSKGRHRLVDLRQLSGDGLGPQLPADHQLQHLGDDRAGVGARDPEGHVAPEHRRDRDLPERVEGTRRAAEAVGGGALEAPASGRSARRRCRRRGARSAGRRGRRGRRCRSRAPPPAGGSRAARRRRSPGSRRAPARSGRRTEGRSR